MLLAVCSDRGAPGATTVALALAAARGLPSVVVEADPYGGDLAVRCRIDGNPLPPTPTVLGLGTGMPAAPTSEGEPRRLDLWRDSSHRLSALVRVVPGFLTAEQGATLPWASVAATVDRRRCRSSPIWVGSTPGRRQCRSLRQRTRSSRCAVATWPRCSI